MKRKDYIQIMNENILRKLQLIELEILKKVHAICQENNIQYYLVGGTLLGAERHQGFIPWDDDLDIAMPRSDYNRFLQLCKEGVLGDNYFLHHTITDENYWLPFAKIRKNNTLFDEESCQKVKSHKGIFIDVFPLDVCKKDKGILYKMKAQIIKKLSFIIHMKVLNIKAPNSFTKICYNLARPFRVKTIAKFRDYLASCCKHGDFYINYGSNYKYTKQTMPRNIYEPASNVLFEGEYFLAPNKSVQYLERLFKNWKQLPPKEERRNHNPVTIIFNTKKKANK